MAFHKNAPEAFTPLWSLAVEEQFYLLWPVVVLVCSHKALRRVALGVVVLSPIARACATPFFPDHFPIYSLTLFRADTLAIGALIAVSEIVDPTWIVKARHLAIWASFLSAILFVLLCFIPSFRTSANSPLFNSLGYSLSALFLGGVLIVALGKQRGPFHSALASWPARYLGRISYTFYLYHVAVILEVSNYVHGTVSVAIWSFGITTLLAAISWHLMEWPILSSR